MDATEGSNPVGYSDLFPALPIFSLVSFICCMLVLPAFIKTRVVALTSCILWLALGNLLICINMCIWRNNTRNIPIYSDFVAYIWTMYGIVGSLNFLCVHKFVWNMTKPGSSLKIYDNRTHYNRVDIFLTTILPILWSPLMLVTLKARYMIYEDLGPVSFTQRSLEWVLITLVPGLVITITSIWFVVLTMINVWRARHIEPPKRVTELGQLRLDRSFSREKVVKYLAFSIFCMTGLVFSCIWNLVPIILDSRTENPLYAKSDIRGNIRQLRLIYITPRNEVNPANVSSRKGFFLSIPVTGVVPLIFFGLGSEALKTYRSWLQNLFSLLKLPTLLNFLQTHMLKLVGWFNQRIVPVDAEYFVPFESNDIALDPHPLVNLSTMSRRSLGESLPTQLRTKPPLYPTRLGDIRPRAPAASSPLQQWRTYRKQSIPTVSRAIHHSPELRPGSEDGDAFTASSRWTSYHEEPLSSRSAAQTSAFASPDQPRFNIDPPPKTTRLDSWRIPDSTMDPPWVSPIRRSVRYDELPPYRPSIDRGSSSDPLSVLF
ncbi:hypothetical protein FRC15_012088 [Serendipita sp. 397]|nr:hypothetical protein FRC15_012088 [Serendipita sp. 397]